MNEQIPKNLQLLKGIGKTTVTMAGQLKKHNVRRTASFLRIVITIISNPSAEA